MHIKGHTPYETDGGAMIMSVPVKQDITVKQDIAAIQGISEVQGISTSQGMPAEQGELSVPMAGSLRSSEEGMMAAVLASSMVHSLEESLAPPSTQLFTQSIAQSLDQDRLQRFEQLCQKAEACHMEAHAQPKAYMLRDFTQWFDRWLGQNEDYIHRHAKAQACYDALTATPIVMGPAASEGIGSRKHEGQALVVVEERMPVCNKG